MAEDREKKTPEQIKGKILDALNAKPLNALDISKAINSNWSTVKSYIVELVKEEKVKELAFGEKNVIYVKVTGDTYFNLPVKEKDRDMMKFIFSNAIREYRRLKGTQIKKTELAKLVYHIDSKMNLKLPIVWYLYGPMPLMIIDVQRDYSTTYIPENGRQIIKEIEKWITEKSKMYVREIVKECYLQSNAKLYDLKQDLFAMLQSGKVDGIGNNAREFYLAYLTGDYSENERQMVYEFYSIVSGLEFLNKLSKEAMSKILIALDGLWKFIASKTLYQSMIKIGYSKDELEIYLGSIIETKKMLAQESLNELNEEYLGALPSKPIRLKENEVMDEWTQSESWRK